VERFPFGLAPVDGSLPAVLPATLAVEAAADENAAAITLSPDLNEAVVTIDQPYELPDGAVVTLQQTTIYRRGNERWLLAPPTAEFWGQWQSAAGPYLTLLFPQRDAEIAQTLVADLNEDIERACTTLADLDCSLDLHLSIRLDDDPATLASLGVTLGALERARESEDILELPTPTLVGLPVGDDAETRGAAYDVLRRGYARHVLAAVIAEATGWECCDDRLLFQVLLEYQLGQLGLLDRPVGAAEYRQVLEAQMRLSDVGRILSRQEDDPGGETPWQARVAVDFLVNAVPDVSVARMQRLITRTSSFNRFLASVWPNSAAGETPPADPETAWWPYAYERSAVAASDEAPVPSPDGDLYLACTSVGATQRPEPSLLFRYLPDEGRWHELYRLDGFIWMTGLRNPDALLLQEFALESEAWQTSLWREGRRTMLFPASTGNYAFSFGQTDPSGEKLVNYAIEPDDGPMMASLVDLGDCDGRCAEEPLPAQPTWSPSGRSILYTGYDAGFPTMLLATSDSRYTLIDSSDSDNDQPLRLAVDGSDELQPVGEGYAPFWLDEATYGYVRHTAGDEPGLSGNTEVVLASLDEPRLQVLISAEELAHLLPEDNRIRRLTIGYVAVHPAQPNTLFIVGLEDLEYRAFVFRYDLTTRVPELRAQLLYGLNHSLSFSPDGRYLVLTGQDRDDATGDDHGALLLHDIAANRTTPFLTRLPFFLASAVYDWSPDGRWLALAMDDNLVALVAPDEGQVEMLPHTAGACTSVAWLE